ncbi:unnamed protein product [Arctia plantaginis]|uniref:CCHC-type domain-containing protein n=1 Tax=Arctia plantaginis TaxID=874455 RepID=A0A8S1ATB5_ARCPL|nr:unnamed protein product [Arctia plantaginis]
MDKEGERILKTPSRSRMRSREVDPIRAYTRTRSRSRHRRGCVSELDRDRERVHRLERELQQERESLRERERSSRQISTERPLAVSPQISDTASAANRADERPENGHRTSLNRSRSPSFTANDFIKILQSIKRGSASELLPQDTPKINKSIDHKNILPNFDPAGQYQSLHVRHRNMTDSINNSNFAPNPKKKPTQGIYCFNCKERGHPYLQCPKPLLKCSKCNRIGHKPEDCFKKTGVTSNSSENVRNTMCITGSSPNAKFTKVVHIDGTILESFVDFGSEVTLIKRSIADKIRSTHDNVPTVMKGFGNELVHSPGSIVLNLKIDDVSADVICRVVDDQFLDKPLLIGQSYTEQPHIIVIKDSTSLRFLDVGTELPQLDPDGGHDQCLKGIVAGHVTLSGTASVKVCTESTYDGDVLINNKWVGIPNNQFLVGGGVHPVRHGQLFVTITPNTIPCFLRGNAVICRVEKVKVVSTVTTVTSEPVSDHGGKIVPADRTIDLSQVRLGQDVPEEVKRQLFDLLQRYKHCFASSLRELGCSHATEMNIELSSQKPVVYRPYRLSHFERDKDAAWEWSDAQETAFLALKKSLINRPILAIFNQNAELELHTDASKVGVGSMLLQRVQGSNDLKPVAYYSRQTSPEEKIFHSYELETLAVICSLKKFRVYLLGKTFKIVTDCSALRSTFQKRDLIPRIARWWLLLQEFDCSIEYRAGAKMAHVDALSRNPVAVECSQILEQAPMIMAISDEDWLLTLQLGDRVKTDQRYTFK